jgi:hypothetical protein
LQELKRKIEILSQDESFRKYTGSAANNKSRVRNRLDIAFKIFEVI